MRRVSAQEGKEGVACRVGSSTFLRHCDVVGVVIISSSTPSSSFSCSFSSSFWSQRVFARSSRLRRSSPFFRYHLFEVARVVLLPSSSSCSRLSVRLVLTHSFDATLRVSIHLRILLRSFARTASEVARSRLQRSLMRVHSFPLSLLFSLFLPLRIGKQSARCLLSSHSTCLLTQASCLRSISLVACA